jgi:hypothetical protein
VILLSKLTLPKYKLAVDNKCDFNTIYFTLLHIYFAGDCFWRFYLFGHTKSIEKETISRQKSLECRGPKFVWCRDDEHLDNAQQPQVQGKLLLQEKLRLCESFVK